MSEAKVKERHINYIMKNVYITDSDDNYETNLAYLESLEIDDLEGISLQYFE